MPDIVQTLENDAKAIGAFITNDMKAIAGAFESNPQLVQAGSTIVTDLKAGASATEQALPTLANAGVNYVLGLVGTSASAPLVDELIDLTITALTAKKSTATA